MRPSGEEASPLAMGAETGDWAAEKDGFGRRDAARGGTVCRRAGTQTPRLRVLSQGLDFPSPGQDSARPGSQWKKKSVHLDFYIQGKYPVLKKGEIKTFSDK